MENVISVKNMRESDAFTINTSVSGKELMQRAARGVYESVKWNGSIAIFCGSGNNGGDGYALAEILFDNGFSPVSSSSGSNRSQRFPVIKPIIFSLTDDNFNSSKTVLWM